MKITSAGPFPTDDDVPARDQLLKEPDSANPADERHPNR